MLNYFIASIFIICCAIAAGTIYLLAKLRNQFRFDFLSSLLFLLVFHFTFGFYSLWGQFIIDYLLKPFIKPDILTRITDIAILLGFPFLVFAWLMLIRFSSEYAAKRVRPLFTFLFLSGNALLITALILYLNNNPYIGLQTLLKYYYIFAFFSVSAAAIINLLLSKKTEGFVFHSRKQIATGLLISASLQFVFLIYYSGNIYLALVFIILFYAGIGFIPVYLNYSGVLKLMIPDKPVRVSLDEFCRKFEVSPREKEIIIEICNGLSNQQIADKLFISLQTVKDHTHRIYGKIDINSRSQLIKKVGELSK